MGERRQLSQDPVDRLLRDLVNSSRLATTEDVFRILERMAMSPFNPEEFKVPRHERGVTYLGMTLGPRIASLQYHLVKRVVFERQWAVGTTADQYLEDLRRAVRGPTSRLIASQRRGGTIAATITLTEQAVPQERLGEQSERYLLVVYSPDHGMILTGYQFSNLDRLSLGERQLWLR